MAEQILYGRKDEHWTLLVSPEKDKVEIRQYNAKDYISIVIPIRIWKVIINEQAATS